MFLQNFIFFFFFFWWHVDRRRPHTPASISHIKRLSLPPACTTDIRHTADKGTETHTKKGEGYTFTGEVYSGVECGQSTGATYPCLMLSRTRLKRVNILSGAFTIHLGTFYTSDGWDDSLLGSCQTVPEYMYINFFLLFLTENPEENGVSGALERRKKRRK